MSLCKEPVACVCVEANVTHTDESKSIERITTEGVYHFMVGLPSGATPREMEAIQRNKIIDSLLQLKPKDDDIIIISDIDEVPRARQINLFKPQVEFAALIMDKYGYYLNWLESAQSWDRARIMSWHYLKDKEPEAVRNSGYDFSLHHAGWHWSYLWNRAHQKLKTFSHQELNNEANHEAVTAKENFWSGEKLKRIELDLSHPEWLLKNEITFAHLIDNPSFKYIYESI
jgi:hypothetical protein